MVIVIKVMALNLAIPIESLIVFDNWLKWFLGFGVNFLRKNMTKNDVTCMKLTLSFFFGEFQREKIDNETI